MNQSVSYQNGAHAPARNGHRPAGKVVPLLAGLADKVDHLAELRALIRQAQQAERELTHEILAALQAAGLDRLAGLRALAVRDTRATLQPDPQLFVEAAGPRAWEAMAVRLEAARRLIAADLLEAISEKTTSPVLRVEALPAGPAAA